MSPAHWTAAEDARLRELRAQGLSAAEIARKLPGRTRNSVIGRMHRLGMQKPKPCKPARSAEPEEPAMAAAKFITMPQRIRCEAVPLWQVRDGQCRWPVGDPKDVDGFRFCGKPVTYARFEWCETHAAVGVSREARVPVSLRRRVA